MFRLVLDPTPEPGPALEDRWQPAAPPSALEMTAVSLVRLAAVPLTAAKGLAGSLQQPRRLARRAAESARGLLTISRASVPAGASSLVGPIGRARRYTWTAVSLDDVRTIRHGLGGTVNDVALTLVSGGFRELLLSRGETPSEHMLRSLVPVSTRAAGAESVPDNQVSLMLPYLPADIADPVERLEAVRERIATLRADHEPEAGESVTSIAEYGPFPAVALGIRLAFHVPQRQIITVTTNVPGPRITLYGLGREVEELLPWVPIADRVRVGVAMYSYRGRLVFGITGDYDTVPDIEVLASGIATSMEQLLAAARQPA
jgi:diacylglycerol O-acyltransferase